MMRLFVVTSVWINHSNDQQQLVGIYEAEHSAVAIVEHLEAGDKKWPGYFHMQTPLAADITGNAVNFTRRAMTETSPELLAEFANIDGPWCRGQMECDDVWKRLLEAQNDAFRRTFG